LLEPLHFDDASAHADAVNRLLVFLFGSAAKKYQTEHFAVIDAVIDHRFVTIFKDM